MIAYTITAPLANGTTYQKTESDSGTLSKSYSESWMQITGGNVGGNGQYEYAPSSHSTSESRNWQGARGRTINADGGEIHSQSGSNLMRLYDSFNGIEAFGGISDLQTFQSGGRTQTIQANGAYTENGIDHYGGTWIRPEDDPRYYEGDVGITSGTYDNGSYSSGSGTGHVMAGGNAPRDSNGNIVAAALYATYTYNGGGGVAVPASLYFGTYASQTTTKTTVTNNYKITTTTKEKLAKVGTTITQQIGTSVVTLPTTTNAKSWTENSATATSSTETALMVTTSMGINSYWKKTAHTIYILGKGETTAFLKSNVSLNATNGGPTDTAAYDTYSGPTTFTITRAAGTTSQKPVVADTATDIGFEQEEGSQITVTRSWIAAANSEGVYYYPGWPHHFPLSSSNITIQTGVTESTSTYHDYKDGTGQWGANAPTTTRSAWEQTSVTYRLAGGSFTEGVWTYTEETYTQPIVRSGTHSYSNDLGVAKDYYDTEIDGEWVETFSTSSIEGVAGNEGRGGGFGEQANYFVNFQNEGRQNNGGGADAFYGLAYAWGTLGGTTATPYQSISVNGINSSESITWPFISISAGVNTPKPFVTVSQKPETSVTTTRRIWGDEFFKLTSSRNSSTGTSGSTTTPIVAGGAAITSFQMGGARGFPIYELANGWIPAPAMFVVGGIAQTNDSTAIISPGEYANSTITAPQSFSGSSIANSYFEPKAARTFICSPS